jgi:hypothetical protein
MNRGTNQTALSEASQETKNNMLYNALYDSIYERVQPLLDAGADPNTKDEDRFSVLHLVISDNAPFFVIKLLIDAGADVNNSPSPTFITPLHYAVKHEREDIIVELLDRGADPNKKNHRGNIPLVYAIIINNFDIVKLLLQRGSNVNSRNELLETPIHIVVKLDIEATSPAQRTAMLSLLLANGAMPSLTLRDTWGFAPYALAQHMKSIRTDTSMMYTSGFLHLLIPPEQSHPWKGITRDEIGYFDIIFSTEGGNEAPAVNFSCCPVCLSFVDRSEACMYMSHVCVEEKTSFHKQLYSLYADARGQIFWCTICGRICNRHRHYALGRHTSPVPALADIEGVIDFFAPDCTSQGGGGIDEKLGRFRTARETFLSLQNHIGKMSEDEAKLFLIEAMWDSPLVPHPSLPIIKIAKTWNIPTDVFPATIIGKNKKNNSSAVAIPWEGAENDMFHPIVSSMGENLISQERVPNVIQFRHRRENGTMNNHLGSTIGIESLFAWLSYQNTNFGTNAFGRCWAYPGECNARLHPDEIQAAMEYSTHISKEKKEEYASILATYRPLFMQKFQKKGGGRKTRRTRGGGGKIPFFTEMKTGQCIVGGGRRRNTNRTRRSKNIRKK